ncbi:MAG: hypothetical protein V2B18_04615 [Pseudomonadota bacterium]
MNGLYRTNMPKARCIFRVAGMAMTVLLISESLGYADGVAEPFHVEVARFPGMLESILAEALCVTVLVEYAAVRLLLRSRASSSGSLFGWVLLVNLITNPVAQCAVLFFDDLKWAPPAW